MVLPLFAAPVRSRHGSGSLRFSSPFPPAPHPLTCPAPARPFCAVISYVSRFEPEYFYGLVAGFVAVADRKSKLRMPESVKEDFVRVREGRSTLAGAAALWTLCVLCYVAWSEVNGAVEQGVGGTVLEVLDKALFATTVLGLQTAVFGLTPIRFMDGHRLWRWNKRIWVLAYAPGAFLFVYLLHMHSGRVLGTSVPESLRLSVSDQLSEPM